MADHTVMFCRICRRPKDEHEGKRRRCKHGPRAGEPFPTFERWQTVVERLAASFSDEEVKAAQEIFRRLPSSDLGMLCRSDGFLMLAKKFAALGGDRG